MYAPCSSVLASTIANIAQSHLHFKVGLSIWSLSIKQDHPSFVTQMRNAGNTVGQREYGSFQMPEGSLSSNCFCHTATWSSRTHKQMWCHGSLSHGLFICWQLCDEGTLVRLAPDCWWRDCNEFAPVRSEGRCSVMLCTGDRTRPPPVSWMNGQTHWQIDKNESSVHGRWEKEKKKKHISAILIYINLVILNAALSLCKTGSM